MSGWQRREVAIPIPCPPTGMRIAAEVVGDRTNGASRHWSEWQDSNRLLLLRSMVSVRTTDPEPATTAIGKALAYWTAPHRLIMFSLDADQSQRIAWSWDPETRDLADQIKDARERS